jgi:hypothetical protein
MCAPTKKNLSHSRNQQVKRGILSNCYGYLIIGFFGCLTIGDDSKASQGLFPLFLHFWGNNTNE